MLTRLDMAAHQNANNASKVSLRLTMNTNYVNLSGEWSVVTNDFPSRLTWIFPILLFAVNRVQQHAP